MLPFEVQPWGHSPTPLLPKLILAEIGHLEAPKSITRVLGEGLTLSEFNVSVWDYVDEVDNKTLGEIINVINKIQIRILECQIYPNEKLLDIPIETIHFSTRLNKAISGNFELFQNPKLKIIDILKLQNCGTKSAIQFACLVEFIAGQLEGLTQTPSKLNQIEEDDSVELSKILSFFRLTSAWGFGERGFGSLSSALPEPRREWPPEIKSNWLELGTFKTNKLARGLYRDYSVPDLITNRLEAIDERLLTIAQERVLVIEKPKTLRELASKFYISGERARQLEEKVCSELKDFKSDGFLPVSRRVTELSEQLGSAIPKNHPEISNSLDWAVKDFKEEHTDKGVVKSLLLWLAGPYHVKKKWLLRDEDLSNQTIKALFGGKDFWGFIDQKYVQITLNKFGIRQKFHFEWITFLDKFLPVEGGFIHFEGSAPDKGYALLQFFNRPMSAEEMLSYIGSLNTRGFTSNLLNDPRFWKVNHQNEFVLAGTEGYKQFTGIYGALLNELKLQGGQARKKDLVNKISRTFGVKKLSVVGYLNTPKFITDKNGITRVRKDGEEIIEIKTNIHKTAGCYLLDNGEWCWRFKVQNQALIGNSLSIPNAFADYLGCNIGKKILFPTELDEITLNWPLHSPTGASISSLRKVLEYFDAKLGDYLFLKGEDRKLYFSLLRQEELNSVDSSLVKLARLLGNIHCDNVEKAIVSISKSLGIDHDSKDDFISKAYQKLTSRGEAKLSELIKGPE